MILAFRSAGLLLGCCLITLPAAAQEMSPPSTLAATASPCLSADCLQRPPDRAVLASRAAQLYRAAPAPRAPLRVPDRDHARAWKTNMVSSAHRPDDDACLLSFTLGGDLDVRGYKGARLFGTTHTLSLPERKAR